MYIFLIVIGLTLLSTVLIAVRRKHYSNAINSLTIASCAATLTLLFMSVLIYACDTKIFSEFETKYELKREYLESIGDWTEPSNINLVIEVCEMNDELFNYQVKYIKYGPHWTFIPSRVMDIEPIRIS